MILVQRANVILEVEDDDASKYLHLGYNIIDEQGNVLNEAVPKDIGTLQVAFVENKKKIKELESEIKSLKAKLKKTKSEVQTKAKD